MTENSVQIDGVALVSQRVLLFGAPRRLLTNQAGNFACATVPNLCPAWRIDKIRTSAYQHAGKGACESLNQTIKRGLRKMLNEIGLEECDVLLSDVMFR